jgi:hypothetical protein
VPQGEDFELKRCARTRRGSQSQEEGQEHRHDRPEAYRLAAATSMATTSTDFSVATADPHRVSAALVVPGRALSDRNLSSRPASPTSVLLASEWSVPTKWKVPRRVLFANSPTWCSGRQAPVTWDVPAPPGRPFAATRDRALYISLIRSTIGLGPQPLGGSSHSQTRGSDPTRP